MLKNLNLKNIDFIITITYKQQNRRLVHCSWSFGVVLWEIITLGDTPYSTIASQDLLRHLKRGYRLPKPYACHPDVYVTQLTFIRLQDIIYIYIYFNIYIYIYWHTWQR